MRLVTWNLRLFWPTGSSLWLLRSMITTVGHALLKLVIYSKRKLNSAQQSFAQIQKIFTVQNCGAIYKVLYATVLYSHWGNPTVVLRGNIKTITNNNSNKNTKRTNPTIKQSLIALEPPPSYSKSASEPPDSIKLSFCLEVSLIHKFSLVRTDGAKNLTYLGLK